jgi:hypothetical protein
VKTNIKYRHMYAVVVYIKETVFLSYLKLTRSRTDFRKLVEIRAPLCEVCNAVYLKALIFKIRRSC